MEFLFCAEPIQVEFFLPSDVEWGLVLDTSDLFGRPPVALDGPLSPVKSRLVLSGPCVVVLSELPA
jgi:hypothetical protein